MFVWRPIDLSLKSLCGGGVPSSHPSLGLYVFFLSLSLPWVACFLSFLLGTGLARTATNTGTPRKESSHEASLAAHARQGRRLARTGTHTKKNFSSELARCALTTHNASRSRSPHALLGLAIVIGLRGSDSSAALRTAMDKSIACSSAVGTRLRGESWSLMFRASIFSLHFRIIANSAGDNFLSSSELRRMSGSGSGVSCICKARPWLAPAAAGASLS